MQEMHRCMLWFDSLATGFVDQYHQEFSCYHHSDILITINQRMIKMDVLLKEKRARVIEDDTSVSQTEV